MAYLIYHFSHEVCYYCPKNWQNTVVLILVFVYTMQDGVSFSISIDIICNVIALTVEEEASTR
jgi:hypothetical protein